MNSSNKLCMSKRTETVKPTVEGKVLKLLRQKHGLSMRQAGEAMNLSDSMISQVENGRADPPRGVKLDKWLKTYGGIGQKYFYEQCRNYSVEHTDEDFIRENLSKLSKDKQKMLKAMVETLLKP